ncbi:MAG: nicotinate (nicotinamide) nucleotide adenylyltransferase [Chloroflexi bacterium]|nr:nicotinate-nucleotide adenylyltransferase [Dehalococcoidia bacterium]PKB85512.1 MAG: nicotinate (nicotinamide) nucleotide adenylyltransferase [SAR202 cluster bacterium MP-NPac-SRR3961935-G1]RUA20083.1 MAG: nicotinate (nicotinamide) nucleotide adenylyltransferase [Chloroflexota bacterium]RUA30364.1 MAG: nicotinate (nicotinamide) nucleotide adenylyltransferase [Chloroflexota bacterium]
MNVGILGGTFDPVHLGHLSIAEAAMDQAGLDRVLFIPAGHPRLKQVEPLASVDHRLEMVRLAIEDRPKFQVCDIEAHRPGPTYSVDTLVELSAMLGPSADLFFILGLDVLGQLDQWKDPVRVVGLCRMLVLDRPGEQDFDWAGFYGRIPEAKGRVEMVTAPLVDVSGTESRRRASGGESLAGQVPDAVAAYIRERGLYLTARKGRTAT